MRPFEGASPYRLSSSGGTLSGEGDWYWSFHHAEESSRGSNDRSDLFAVATFNTTLHPGSTWNLEATTELDGPRSEAGLALERERGRQATVLVTATAADMPSARQQLTLAADQFIVRRGALGEGELAVIAGYHWFNDWGRDTMIALPGLLLVTGQHAEAAVILRNYAGYVRDGLLPNNFPDQPHAEPGYNTGTPRSGTSGRCSNTWGSRGTGCSRGTCCPPFKRSSTTTPAGRGLALASILLMDYSGQVRWAHR